MFHSKWVKSVLQPAWEGRSQLFKSEGANIWKRLCIAALAPAFVGLALVGVSGTARANDALTSTVTIPDGQPSAIIKDNGNATGTIQLLYTPTSCTVGQFAQFNLNLTDTAGNGASPMYPVTVSLVDDGKGTAAQASPASTSLTVTGSGWTNTDLVTIFITDCSGVTNGSTAIANLNVSSSGSHLDTITSVQVHITFSISSSSRCLNLYSFETDQGTGDPLNAVTVNAKKSGSVTGTSPGQASVDALVVNNCGAPVSFDVAMGLDPEWQTNPSGNAGNATFFYTQSGELDPVADFNLVSSLITSSTGTSQHEAVCLQNVTLPAGQSYLVTVHSEIRDGLTIAQLPIAPDSDFDFGTTIFAAGSHCTNPYAQASIVNAFHENDSGYSDIDDPSGATTATSDMTFIVKQP
jgi:hypothetical protein